MKSILKRAAQAFALAAVLSASAAQASVTDWLVHDPLEVGGGGVLSSGPFDDFFKFTMPSNGGLSSVAVSNNLLTILGITSGTVTLWQGLYGNPNPTQLLSYSFDGTTGSTPHSVSGLLSGFNYFYEVKGNASGSLGGIYVLTSTLVPVPEADTYAMMLAGLGLMAFVARRRKKSQDVTAA